MQHYYILFIVFFVLLFIVMRRNKLAVVKRIIKNRKSEDKIKMVELAKKFIGKDCLIYSFDSNRQFSGIIKEVTDGALLVEKEGEIEAINLDFVIRIREYPKNKKGKKKSVIVD